MNFNSAMPKSKSTADLAKFSGAFQNPVTNINKMLTSLKGVN